MSPRIKARRFTSLAAALLALALTPALSQADLASSAWPMFQHDAQHTGRSTFLGAQDNALQWRLPILFPASGEAHTAAPVLGEDGTVYVGTMNRADYQGLWAVYPYGTPRWQYNVPIRIRGAAAVTADGSIVAASNDHNLYRVNPAGSERWRVDPFVAPLTDFSAAPLVGPDGTIYIGRQTDGFWAFNGDGSVRWHFDQPISVPSSAAFGQDGSILFGARDGFLYSLDSGGNQNWRFDLGDTTVRFASPSVGDDGTIYMGTPANGFFAINPDGTQLWHQPGVWGVHGAPALAADGTIYVAGQDHSLYAMESDGDVKWVFDSLAGAYDVATSSPVIGVDGTVYASLDTDKMFAIDPSGTELWRYDTDGAIFGGAAIGQDGTIYFGSDDGHLYAIIPEPGSISLLILGAAWLTRWSRRN